MVAQKRLAKQFRLRAETLVFEVSPGLVQVGSTPEHSVLLTGIDQEELAWLNALAADKKQRTIPPRAPALLKKLEEAGLLRTPSPLEEMRVRVQGLDRIGLRLMQLLANAGVRALEVRDRRPVDDQVSGLLPAHTLGITRQKAAKDALKRCCPDTRVTHLDQPDLVFVSSARVWDHGVLSELVSHDVAHLPVVQEDRAITVGPLIAPGRTPCALCIDKHVQDTLPQWPQMHMVLQTLSRLSAPDHLCAAGAGLALAMAEAVVNNRPLSPTVVPLGLGPTDTAVAWRISDSGLDHLHWRTHRKCACTQSKLSQKAG